MRVKRWQNPCRHCINWMRQTTLSAAIILRILTRKIKRIFTKSFKAICSIHFLNYYLTEKLWKSFYVLLFGLYLRPLIKNISKYVDLVPKLKLLFLSKCVIFKVRFNSRTSQSSLQMLTLVSTKILQNLCYSWCSIYSVTQFLSYLQYVFLTRLFLLCWV